jgi:plastocyanin
VRHLLLLALFVAAACAGAPAASPAGGGGGGAGQQAGGGSVNIVDFAFQPQAVTVRVGQTVTWTNNGDAPHTVKWQQGAPESPRLSKGSTYQRTFDAAGTFPYVCGIHSNMTGTVTVSQ